MSIGVNQSEDYKGNLDDFINQVFCNQPKGPHKYNLDLTESVKCDDDIFNIMVEIFTKGMSIRFGDSIGQVNVANLVKRDFELIREYFHSFGITIYLNIDGYHVFEFPEEKLSDDNEFLIKYVLNIEVGDVPYVIRFDSLPIA